MQIYYSGVKLTPDLSFGVVKYILITMWFFLPMEEVLNLTSLRGFLFNE